MEEQSGGETMKGGRGAEITGRSEEGLQPRRERESNIRILDHTEPQQTYKLSEPSLKTESSDLSPMLVCTDLLQNVFGLVVLSVMFWI